MLVGFINVFLFFFGSGLIATLPDCWMRQVDGGCWIRDVDWMRFGLTASSIARKNAENDDRGGEIGGRGGGGTESIDAISISHRADTSKHMSHGFLCKTFLLHVEDGCTHGWIKGWI